MKKVINFILLFIGYNSFSQAPAIEWQKTYGGFSTDYAYAIKQLSDGDYLVAGIVKSTDGDVVGNFTSNNFDNWVIRINSTGQIMWQKLLGGSQDELVEDIFVTSDGNFLISGYTKSNDGDVTNFHGNQDGWIVKLNPSGNIMWQKTLGGSNEDKLTSVTETADGSYLITGTTNSNNQDVIGNHGGFDGWLVKLNSGGNILWQKTYGGTGNEYISEIIPDSDSSYILSGDTTSVNGDVTSNNGGKDFWLLKIDSMGEIIWQKTFGGTLNETCNGTVLTLDGGFLLYGISASSNGDVITNYGADDYWIIKLDSGRNIEWQKTFGSNSNDFPAKGFQLADGNFAIFGFAYSGGNLGDVGFHNQSDFLLLKLNQSGNIIWQKPMGGGDYDYGFDMSITSDNGFILAGYTRSVNGDVSGLHGSSYPDFWVVKLEPDLLKNPEYINNQFTVFPNPSKMILNVKTKSGKFDRILISNTLGQIMIDNTSNQLSQIDISNLANGIYNIQVFDNDYKYISHFIKN